jgi:lipopolysaccharide transport system permease protein
MNDVATSTSGAPASARRWGPFRCLLANRDLVTQLVRREVAGRYRGSMLGILWSLVNPMLMLAVYTFVFAVVFKARWTDEAAGGNVSFAATLFVGLIVFGIFSECVVRAPNLVVSQPNYVKKVVFPLEVLPWVSMFAALFHAAISVVVLLVLLLMTLGGIPPTALLLPLVALPVVLWTMGLSWLLSSLGVFLRDIGQIVSAVTTTLLFLTPIFFPASALPPLIQRVSHLNPLLLPVEQARATVIFGHMIDWSAYLVSLMVSIAAMYAGYWWFMRTRRAFADVV